MNYTRIYCDGTGDSHFDDTYVEVAPVDFAPPAPPLHLATPVEAERMILCHLPQGWVGEWHPTPRRQFYIQLSGRLGVEVSDGEVREFGAGSVVLLEDSMGKGHLTTVLGGAGVEAVFVQLPVAADADR
jgi:hypothetical protein